jgi:hypothetical protein
MKKTQEPDKLFEIYVICYKQMCDEIDEMTKPLRGESRYYSETLYECCDICNEMYIPYLGYGNHLKTSKGHAEAYEKHLRREVDENKYLLHWRAMNYINNLNSKK